MKSLMTTVAVMALTCSADVTWIGGESGSWMDGANWDSGTAPNACVVAFTNAGTVTVSYPAEAHGKQVRGFVVRNGNVSIVPPAGSSPTLYMESKTFAADIGENASLDVKTSMWTYYPASTFTKRGTGTFASGGPFDPGGNIYRLRVEEGSFQKLAGGNFYARTNSVASGASLVMDGAVNTSSQNPLVELEEGATLRMLQDSSVTIGDLTGSGRVVADGAATLTVTRLRPPETEFAGVLAGPLTLTLPVEAATGTRPKFLVTRADMLADGVQVVRPGGLSFATGVGTFRVASMDGLYGGTIALEDAEGAPVTVYAGLQNASQLGFSGTGSIFVTNTVVTLSGANMDPTVTLGVSKTGSLTVGDSFDLAAPGTSVCEIRCEGGTLSLSPAIVDVPVVGTTAQYDFSGKDRKFSSFCLDAASIRVFGDYVYELAGGEALISKIWRFTGTGATYRISGGTFSGPWTADGYDDVTALPCRSGVPIAIYQASTDYGTFEMQGGEFWLQAGSGVRNVCQTGGRLHFTMPFSQNVSGGEAAVVFDGGQAVLEVRASPFEFGAASTYYKRRVGAGGAHFSLGHRAHTKTPNVYFHNSFAMADGVTADGGVSLEGNATYRFDHALAINGPFCLKDGKLTLSEAQVTENAAVFGTGDFRIGTAELGLTDYFGNAFSKPLSLASGAESAFVYDGAASVVFRSDGAKAFQHITVGGLRRGGKGSVLTLTERYNTIDKIGVDGGDSFVVSGRTSSDFVREPVVIAGSGCDDAYFARYDATDGFRMIPNADCKAFADAGADDPVYVSENVSLGEGETKQIAGAKLHSWLWIGVGKDATLTVGDGTNPALFLFKYGGGVNGAGVVDFRGSEGIFYAGSASDTTTYHDIACRLTGSGGVSYVATPDYLKVRKFIVSGDNDYRGGTYIRACSVHARSATGFASGDVYIGPGESCGGRIIFDRPLTFGNSFHVEGWGMYKTGVFDFEADATVCGTVELTGETRMTVAGGVTGRISGSLSGDRLVVYGGSSGTTGVLALTGDNVHTGGTEVVKAVLAVSDGKGLGTGTLTLDNGTLELRSAKAVTIGNRIEGVGTVRLKGRGEATFADLSSLNDVGFTLDLAARTTRIRSLAGFRKITTSRADPISLYVADAASASSITDVPANVTIHDGPYVPPGMLLLVR